MREPNLSDCISQEDLAALLEDAFARWGGGQRDDDPRRQTPRIPVQGVKPLYVVSYSAYDIPLNCQAVVTDVSADGFGIIMEEPLPVGATLQVAFESKTGEGNYGVAVVACSVKQANGYRIGLRFAEHAGALDAGIDAPAQRWHRTCDQLKRAAAVAYRTISKRQDSLRRMQRTVDDQRAALVVEARLFRYTAALSVNGRRVVSRSGVLRERMRNLCSNSGHPTTITLTSGGFSAWAVLRPNAVMQCGLEPSAAVRSRAGPEGQAVHPENTPGHRRETEPSSGGAPHAVRAQK